MRNLIEHSLSIEIIAHLEHPTHHLGEGMGAHAELFAVGRSPLLARAATYHDAPVAQGITQS